MPIHIDDLGCRREPPMSPNPAVESLPPHLRLVAWVASLTFCTILGSASVAAVLGVVRLIRSVF